MPSMSGMRTSISTTSARTAASEAQRLPAVAGLGHYLQVRLGIDQHLEPAADQLLVIDQRHPDESFGGIDG